jgi:exodeoxyribonuclease V beta subunit
MTFDPYGPLPTGTTVLEASAGTGKTWTIATLATRYVAEGRAELSQLMLATFSRAATQELRERVRSRFASTLRGLHSPDDPDPLVQLLREVPAAEFALRRRRLARALSDFDRATIATTHSFCQQVLDGLGMSGDSDPGATVVEHVDDLLREVVDDLFLRAFAVHDAAPPVITPREAREVARAAVGDRQARLEPADAGPDSAAGQRVRLASGTVEELERRKRRASVRSPDDLLVLLRDVLRDPARGPAACRRLRERYRVVLVDEFQDTDPVQWEILRRAFAGSVDLVLIGDPKQAIYAFRGAEVLSYLAARREAGEVSVLGTNWRTDEGLVRALHHLYGGAALGHPEIRVPPVEAHSRQSRLPGTVPLRLRVVGRAGAGPLGRGGYPAVAALRRRVADDVADEVVRLLESGTPLCLDGHERPVRPGDVAVLVRKHAQAALVHDALARAGVPCVLSSGSSVFATPSARDWLWLLQALEQPHRAGRARLAALTPLVGWTAERLDAGSDDALEQVAGLLRDAAARFAEAGLAGVFEQLSGRTGLESRVLAVEQGERRLTDLRHVAQALDRVAVEQSLGLSALVTWLGERIEDPEGGSAAERSRRLETDAAAVQVVTVHASKGLEFPVVLVPYGWDSTTLSSPATLRLHDASGDRVLDVGGKGGPGWDARRRQAEAEDDAEELRLLYVALTRAQCAVGAWWAPSAGASSSPLQRLLLGRTPGVAEPAARVAVPEDAAALARLAAWGWPDEIAVEQVGPAQHLRWAQAASEPGPLSAAQFRRDLDHTWRRTSYSALTSSVHEDPGVRSEPEAPEKTDEPAEPPVQEAPAAAPAAQADPGTPPSPMNGLPGGAAFGTLVHAVLEIVDTGAQDLPAELRRACRDAVARRLAPVDPVRLAAALLPVLQTSLDGSLGLASGTLADIRPGDRLAELDFELPLSGGDTPRQVEARLADLAALLRAHLPSDDVLAPYADLLADVEAAPLRGYLVGSLDAVLRLPGPSFVVVDYKTNRLGRGELTALHYTREAMAAEMLRAHYPLQALLYAVALHRYLRWRLPGYDPGRHLGGVQYLFVRGMAGPQTPAGCGVFDWRPPPALVTGLSDLLAGS